MNASETITIPEVFQPDLERAVQILKDAGCTEIYLFGSLAEGRARDDSDIDLAVKECPRGRYFRLWGDLQWESKHLIELVKLDPPTPFTEFLQRSGKLVRLG